MRGVQKMKPRERAITQTAKLESIKLLIGVYPPWVRNSSGAVRVNGQADRATCTTAAKPLKLCASGVGTNQATAKRVGRGIGVKAHCWRKVEARKFEGA